MTLSGASTPDQSEPWSHGNERVLRIPQSSSIIGASPSDCLMSYAGCSLARSYSSADIQWLYSTTPACIFFSDYGPPQMAEQKQVDQLEPTYSSSVRIRDVVLRTCQKRWTIGRSGERGSVIPVLAARHDDEDDDV